jgi:opacity protein-like surface antigen
MTATAHMGHQPRTRAIAIAIALLSTTVALTATADDGRSSPQIYLSGFAGGSWMQGEASGFNNVNGAPNVGTGSDASPFGGAALGVTLDLRHVDLRLEIEGTGGRSFTMLTPSGAGSYTTNIDTWTMQGNFWFEYSLGRLFPNTPIVNRLAPFGGGGVGLAQHNISTHDGNVAGQNDRSEFAWQGGVGLAVETVDKLTLDMRYQYTDFGQPTATLRNASGDQGSLGMNMGGNEFIASIRFTY